MKLGQEIVSCTYDSGSATDLATAVRANQEDTGYLAVTLDGDNIDTTPVPHVKLVSAAGEYIYGALATINTASERCGVLTTGIVPLKKDGANPGARASATADIGVGIKGGGTTNGKVVAAAAGQGRGTTIGRTGEILWVDLDVDANTVS